MITDKILYCEAALMVSAMATIRYTHKYLVIRALSIGIFSWTFQNFANRIFCHSLLLKSQNEEIFRSISGERVALIIQSDNDKAGAFKLLEDQLYAVEKLAQGGYSPIFRYVTTLNEIENSLVHLAGRENRIELLWFRAHGSAARLNIGKKQYLDSKTLEVLKPALDKISADGIVILESCSTAASSGESSIAEKIAKSLPGRTLYAAKSDTYSDSLEVVSTQPIEILFKARCYSDSDVTKVYKF
jgi:hypothetical protein